MDPHPREVTFPCFLVRQPIGEFYIGSIPHGELCNIANFDVRRILQEERDVERYLGIQRPLVPNRVKLLEQYVNFVDASFPTSIIIAVEEEFASFDPKRNMMTLSNVGVEGRVATMFRKLARVLDGQHRIAGLYEYKGNQPFDVNITLFVGLDLADQAHIFSTVNLEQTKVNRSLAYDLFSLASTRSPQKSCHNIAIALDRDEGSPFFRRIKRLGSATKDEFGIPLAGRENETITQARFVKSLIDLITPDAAADRDRLLRGRSILVANDDLLREHPFRNLFAKGEEGDFVIADIVKNYFTAIARQWPVAWADTQRGGRMLCRSNGFAGFMAALRAIYLSLTEPGNLVDVEGFSQKIEQLQLKDDDFTVERFPPGSTGETRLRDVIVDSLGVREYL